MKNSESGQFTLEAVLLLSILVGGMIMLYNKINSDGWAKQMVEGPWKPVKGMIEDGEWSAGGSKDEHSNLLKRHGSKIGGDAEAE